MKVENARSIWSNGINSLRRRIRLVLLLDTAEKAGITPLPILNLHTLAYLSNVLSPVWDISVIEGKVLKRRGGPFYPNLQHDLDRLVGSGVALISELSHVQDEENRWRIEGSYHLNHEFANRILGKVMEFEAERQIYDFLQELAYAVSALNDTYIQKATTEDATYADPLIDNGNVIDFAEWQNKNFSANAARFFKTQIPTGALATRGEMLHLYVQHLRRRLRDEQ